MQLPFKRLAIFAIVLVQGAESASVLAGTELGIPRESQERHDNVATSSEYSSRPACEMGDPYEVVVSGFHSNFKLRNLPYAARIDARGATFETSTRRRTRAGVFLHGGTNLCWIGGHILSHPVSQSSKRTVMYDSSAALLRNFHPQANISIYNIVVETHRYGITIAGEVRSVIIGSAHIQKMLNSCILLDVFNELTVRNSLFDGCGRLLESNTNQIGGNVILENNLINFNNQTPSGDNGYMGLKEHPFTSVTMRNNVILVNGRDSSTIDYLTRDLSKNIISCDNNVFIVPEMDPREEIHTECGLITYDKTIWEAAKSEWLNSNLDDRSNFDAREIGGNGTPSLDVRMGTVRSSHRVHRGDSQKLAAETRVEVVEARNPVSDSQKSAHEAIAAAQRAARAVGSFLGRWSDETFWLDGTGWVE